MTEIDRTAVHEAGHAVIGRVLTLPCGPATAREDHDSVGHSVTADPYAAHHAWTVRGKFRSFESALVGRIITFMAGAEVEVAVFGVCAVGDGDDRLQIGLMLEELGFEERIEKRLRRTTRHLVNRHLATILKVAKMLETKGSLTSEEIDAALPNGAPLLRRPVITVAVADGEPDLPAITLHPPKR